MVETPLRDGGILSDDPSLGSLEKGETASVALGLKDLGATASGPYASSG